MLRELSRLRRSVCLTLFAVLILSGGVADAAQGRAKQRPSPQQKAAAERKAIQAGIRQAQTELLAAQRVLSSAGQQAANAQAKAASAADQAGTAADRIRAAQADAKIAEEHLRELGKQIEESQPADSPLAQAKTRYRDVADALHDAEERVLAAPEVKPPMEAAQAGGDGARFAELRSVALENSREYQQAKLLSRLTKSTYDDLREKLLRSNEDWRTASEELRTLRRDLAQAEQQLTAAKLHEAGAKDKHRDAARAAAPAQTAAANAAAKLNQLQAREKKLSAKQPSKQSSSKRGKR